MPYIIKHALCIIMLLYRHMKLYNIIVNIRSLCNNKTRVLIGKDSLTNISKIVIGKVSYLQFRIILKHIHVQSLKM